VQDLLDRLEVLLPEVDRPAVAELRRRLREDRLRILFAGEAKRGKSTLINALLGRELLPTGVLPLTAITTTLTYGDKDAVTVSDLDDRSEVVGPDRIADFVTEAGNPDNVRGVAEVVVRTASPLLQKGVELVDTPGVGSIYEHNTAHARTALARMDVCIFVMSADPPLSATEREFLHDIKSLAIRFFSVLSKADQLDTEELAQVQEFVGDVLGKVLGEQVIPIPVSARRFLTGADDSGIPLLLDKLTSYLNGQRGTDLRASIAVHGRRLTQRAMDEVRLTARAATLSAESIAEQQQAFSDRLAVVRRLADESQSLLQTGIAHLVAATNAAAAETVPRATTETLAGLDEWAATQGNVPPAELDRAGRELLAGRVAAVVTSWRARHERKVDHELDALVADLRSRLQEQIDAVRAAAAEAFDMSAAGSAAAVTLTAETRFRSRGSEMAGFSELLAAGIRTRLPGALARRRILDRLRADAPELVDRAFGRARADFQQRLTETGRHLTGDLARQHEQAVVRVNDALLAGQELSRQNAAHRDKQLARLNHQVDELEHLAREFGRTFAGERAIDGTE
jgi:GTP-binding protein EngB required for normal cell division